MAELARAEEKAKSKSNTWYDKKARERCFEVGAQVLALLPEDTSKLQLNGKAPTGDRRSLASVILNREAGEKEKDKTILCQHVKAMDDPSTHPTLQS